MAKRASIKGKGVDILFGEKAPHNKPALEIEREVDIEELLGGEADLAEPELDAELENAFGEEVTAMEPVPPTPVTPAAEPAPPRAAEMVPPPLEVPPFTPVTPAGEAPPPKVEEVVSPPLEVPPSSEPRKVSVTLRVEEPPPPPAEPAPRVEEVPPTPTYPPVTPAPTVEAPPTEMPARRWEEAPYGPPPRVAEPAAAEAAPTAPPGRPLVSPYDRPPPEIKPGGYLVEHPVAVGEEAGLPTGVVPREGRVEAERVEEIPPQISPEVTERTVLSRLGEERQSNLPNEIDTLLVEAAQILSVDNKGLEEALSLLREARDISVERPRQFDQAEYRVAKVRAMLERKQNISRWSLIYGYPVLLYEVVWFLLLLGSLLFDHSLAVFIANITGMTFSDMASLSMQHIFPLWNTMAWGGIGGVVGSLYSLYWHAAVEQDFDKQYVMWYFVQPIMGVILGGIVYMIIGSGFMTVQVLAGQAATVGEATQSMANPAVQAFHSVVACVAGFRQRFVYEMLDKIVQILTPAPKTRAEREAEIAQKSETG
jgi:hypothetical protein